MKYQYIDTPCIIKKGYTTKDGYTRVHFDGAVTEAHRWSYQKFKGEIPKDYEIDHLCNRRNCINPFHLEAVTKRENRRRQGWRKTICANGHERKPENLRPSGGCQVCAREQWMRRYSEKKDAIDY